MISTGCSRHSDQIGAQLAKVARFFHEHQFRAKQNSDRKPCDLDHIETGTLKLKPRLFLPAWFRWKIVFLVNEFVAALRQHETLVHQAIAGQHRTGRRDRLSKARS